MLPTQKLSSDSFHVWLVIVGSPKTRWLVELPDELRVGRSLDGVAETRRERPAVEAPRASRARGRGRGSDGDAVAAGKPCSRPSCPARKTCARREARPEDAVVHRSRCVTEEAAVVDVRQPHTGIADPTGSRRRSRRVRRSPP